MITQDLGIATAYGYAKSKGYTGTEAEFAELMASYAEVGQTAVDAAQAALASETAARNASTTATNKASEATTAAQTATSKAAEASTSASTATSAKDTAVSASQTATTKAGEATTAAATATSAATTATTAKDDAVSAKTAAQAAQTAAETAQGKAEDSADEIASSAAQIAQNTSDISELKSDLNDVNAELADVRVGADGTTYGSAGAAVRGQIKDIKDILGWASVISISDYQLGSRHSSGNWSYDTTTAITNKLYSFRSGTVISVTDPNYKFLCCDSSGEYNKYYVGWCTTSITFTEDVQVYAELRKTDNSAIDINALDGILVAEYSSGSGLIDDVKGLKISVDTLKAEAASCYVNASSGSNSNDGTLNHPFATITYAISKGYKNILVAKGVYSERLNFNDVHGLKISPYNYGTFDGASYDDKIVLDGINTRPLLMLFENCSDITLVGIKVINFTASGIRMTDCTNMKCINCDAGDQYGTYQYGIGFELINTNAEFESCYAHDVTLDGFNIHGFGVTKFVNCSAYNCGDDGISHHDACIGYISGGEYSGCGKGGIASPTYGSYINIESAYCHDNLYGIYAVSKDTNRKSKAMFSNCAVKNNTGRDIYVDYTDVIGWNNLYSTKNVGSNGTFTDIS